MEIKQLQNIKYRVADTSDITCLLELEQAVVEAERPFNSAIKHEGAKYYDLDALLQDDKSLLLVAELDQKIVATGYVQIRSSKQSLSHNQHGYLGFMYVDPLLRGMGVNKKLIAQLIQWGKAQGVLDFYLDVYAGNDSAIRAYEKLGFEFNLLEMKLNIDT
ncbi:GNAT family N-acetyltransferase [Marinomonas epiphytica]